MFQFFAERRNAEVPSTNTRSISRAHFRLLRLTRQRSELRYRLLRGNVYYLRQHLSPSHQNPAAGRLDFNRKPTTFSHRCVTGVEIMGINCPEVENVLARVEKLRASARGAVGDDTRMREARFGFSWAQYSPAGVHGNGVPCGFRQ